MAPSSTQKKRGHPAGVGHRVSQQEEAMAGVAYMVEFNKRVILIPSLTILLISLLLLLLN